MMVRVQVQVQVCSVIIMINKTQIQISDLVSIYDLNLFSDL